jgi:hypothetical protein
MSEFLKAQSSYTENDSSKRHCERALIAGVQNPHRQFRGQSRLGDDVMHVMGFLIRYRHGCECREQIKSSQANTVCSLTRTVMAWSDHYNK